MSIGEEAGEPLDDHPWIKVYQERLSRLLEKASELKPESTIDPPLQLSDFEADISQLDEGLTLPSEAPEDIWSDNDFWANAAESMTDQELKGELSARKNVRREVQNAPETAAHSLFYPLITETPITSPAFVQVWNLIDILQFCADLSKCDPSLPLSHLEELLDSQTIEGCKIICDYMESRRERLMRLPRDFKRDIGGEGTKQREKYHAERDAVTRLKQMTLLRSCNELQRRLSRAEDAVFCGRVFIFLFKSFPLGDRSAVNLRAEFHTTNVTVFDDLTKPQENDVPFEDKMQVDAVEAEEEKQAMLSAESQPQPDDTTQQSPTGPEEDQDKGREDADSKKPEEKTDIDALYTSFWSLQHAFSDPQKLWHKGVLDEFKKGLDMTIEKFKTTPKVLQSHGSPRSLVDSQQGKKRKRGDENDAFATTFNSKYLTSRDLFELELSDLTFQRHILVQALIVIDFLLSLTAKAKERFSEKTQKVMRYAFTLSDEDTAWARSVRSSITSYLQADDGKLYYRMADTVLSREKNWALWKEHGCPPISKPPISTEDQLSASSGAKRACTSRRIKANPMGAIDMSFVSDTNNVNGLDTLRGADRCNIEGTEKWVRDVEQVDLDLEMADGEEADYLKEGKTTAVWRALRVAARRRFNILDKVDEGGGLGALKKSVEEVVGEQAKTDEETVEAEVDGADGPEVKVDPAEQSEVAGELVQAEEAEGADKREEPNTVETQDETMADDGAAAEEPLAETVDGKAKDAAVEEEPSAVEEDAPAPKEIDTVMGETGSTEETKPSQRITREDTEASEQPPAIQESVPQQEGGE